MIRSNQTAALTGLARFQGVSTSVGMKFARFNEVPQIWPHRLAGERVGYGMWGMSAGPVPTMRSRARRFSVRWTLAAIFSTPPGIMAAGTARGCSASWFAAIAERGSTSRPDPQNLAWPARTDYSLDDCFPPDHIEHFVRTSLKIFALALRLMQFHTWSDHWLRDDRWAKKIEELRAQGLFEAVGISLNRWEPWNGVGAVRSGLIDSVQVMYNIFDQNPEDELFPACAEMDVAVIARCPLDQGSLTGTLTLDSKWPEGDWRNKKFNPGALREIVEHADAVKTLVPAGKTLPEMALRFVLSNPEVATVIPGMRKAKNVEQNLRTAEDGPLHAPLLAELRKVSLEPQGILKLGRTPDRGWVEQRALLPSHRRRRRSPCVSRNPFPLLPI